MAISRKNEVSHGKEMLHTSSFLAMLEAMMQSFPERTKTIVLDRFGVRTGKAKTLEEIGRTYGITRERVRQIVDNALRTAARREVATLTLVEERIAVALQAMSGIAEKSTLLVAMAGENIREQRALLALLECSRGVKMIKENRERLDVFVVSGFDMDEWKAVREAAVRALDGIGEVSDTKKLLAATRKYCAEKIVLTEKRLEDFLAASTDIEKNVFGKWGMTSWSSVRPHGTRERAHLILHTLGDPLHFREIAKKIDEYGLQRKSGKTHPQTVHNELIKDKRFVLIGRGIYALSEWGYVRGTVKEVIADILGRGKTPMTRDEVLVAVLKVRQVKKSTVVINLNAFFMRVGKDRYAVPVKK